MEHVTIVDAQPEDAQAIVNVLHKTWLATYPNKELGITVEDIEESYKDSFLDENLKKLADKIARLNTNEKRLVAKVGDSIVGVSTMVKNEDNNQLKTIYVLPEFQGKGIGYMLWEEGKKFCDPMKKTIVHVATYNQKAIDFYKKLGFVDTGKRFSDDMVRGRKMGVQIPEMEMVMVAKYT